MTFLADVAQQLAAELVAMGCVLPAPQQAKAGDDPAKVARIPVENSLEVLRAYYSALLRRPAPRPRRIHWSRELYQRLGQLSPALQAGLFATALDIFTGEDLLPRLSRQIARPMLPKRDKPDLILNDWGLHHLHLGVSTLPSGIVPGANEILFAMLDADDAYLVDVGTHHSWVDVALVEIIHANWPSTLKRWRRDGVTGFHLSPQQRRNLRSKKVNTLVQMKDGTVYMAIGGGNALTGINMDAVRWADWISIRTGEIAATVSEAGWLASVGWSGSAPRARLEWFPDRYVVHLTDGAMELAVSFEG